MPTVFVGLLFLLMGFKKDLPGENSEAKWTGRVVWTKTSSGKAKVDGNSNGHPEIFRWNNSLVFRITVDFVDSKGTIYRADTTKKWEKDSTFFGNPDVYMIEERTTNVFCKGKDVFELEVEFDADKKNYWLRFETPNCPEFNFHEIKNSIHGTGVDSFTLDHPGIQLTLPTNFTGQPIGNTPTVLSGTYNEMIPPNPDDPAKQAIVINAKWDLRRSK
jgi:hypothetical protein